MKFGIRKPSVKRRIKARTTGRAKRSVKRAVNPVYGKKGMGWVNNPKKAAYNKVYNKTTVDSTKALKSNSNRGTNSTHSEKYIESKKGYTPNDRKGYAEKLSLRTLKTLTVMFGLSSLFPFISVFIFIIRWALMPAIISAFVFFDLNKSVFYFL